MLLLIFPLELWHKYLRVVFLRTTSVNFLLCTKGLLLDSLDLRALYWLVWKLCSVATTVYSPTTIFCSNWVNTKSITFIALSSHEYVHKTYHTGSDSTVSLIYLTASVDAQDHFGQPNLVSAYKDNLNIISILSQDKTDQVIKFQPPLTYRLTRIHMKNVNNAPSIWRRISLTESGG